MKKLLLLIAILCAAGTLHAQNVNVVNNSRYFSTTGYVASQVIKAGPGSLYNFTFRNGSASTVVFIHVVDSATLPTESTNPTLLIPPIQLSGGGTASANFSTPLKFQTGLTIYVNVDSSYTKTISLNTAGMVVQYQ